MKFLGRFAFVVWFFFNLDSTGFEADRPVRVQPAWTNRVQDPSAEGDGWQTTGGASLTAPARTGKRALRIQRTRETAVPICRGEARDLAPGLWMLSGWFLPDTSTSADRNFSCETDLTWLDADRKPLGRARGPYSNGRTPDWVFREELLRAPPGTVRARIEFGFTGAIVGSCLLDDLVLTPAGTQGARMGSENNRVAAEFAPVQPIFSPNEPVRIRVRLTSPARQQTAVTCAVRLFDSFGLPLAEGHAPGIAPKSWRRDVEVALHPLAGAGSALPVGEWLEIRGNAKQADTEQTLASGRCGVLVLLRPRDYALRPDSPFAMLVGHPYTKRWLGARWERPNLVNERLLELAHRYGVICMPMFPVPVEHMDDPGTAEEFSRAVGAYVQRNAKYLDWLQIGNEPALFRPGVTEKYMKALRLGAAAARKAKPGIRIAAAGITGLDVDEEMVARLLDAGAARFCDMIDIHTYLSISTMDRIVGKVRRQMDARGVRKPLIITEVTANLGAPLPERDKAGHVWKRYAIALSHGVEQVYWFVMHGVNDLPGGWGYCGLIDVHNHAPWPAAAAYSRMTRALDGLSFVSRETRGPLWRFTFGNKSRRVIVCWADETGAGVLRLTHLGGAPIRVWDVAGREFAFQPTGNRFVLNLLSEPLLISGPTTLVAEFAKPEAAPAVAPISTTVARGCRGRLHVNGLERVGRNVRVVPEFPATARTAMSAPDVCDVRIQPNAVASRFVGWFRLKQGKTGGDMGGLRVMLDVTDPLRAELLPRVSANGVATVEIQLRNLADSALSGTALLTSPITLGLRPEVFRIQFKDLRPGELGRSLVTLPRNPGTLPSLPFALSVSTDSGVKAELTRKLVFTCGARSPKALHIDGDLADWASLPIPIGPKGGARKDAPGSNPEDPADLSATAGVQWDEHFLYLALRVRDDTHVNRRRDGALWDGDSVQIGIAAHPDTSEAATCEFTLGLGAAGAQCWFARNFTGLPTGPARFPFSVVRVAGETRYEVAIPWKALPGILPRTGTWFALGVLVNEDDGQGRGWLGWHAGIASDKDPALFGQVTLSGPAADQGRHPE